MSHLKKIENEIVNGNKSKIVNYGCGKNILYNSINIDLVKDEYVDVAIEGNIEYQNIIRNLEPEIILCLNPYNYHIEDELIFNYLKIGGYILLVGSPRNPYFNKYLDSKLNYLEVLEIDFCNNSIINFGNQRHSSGTIIPENIKMKNMYILMKKAS